MKVQNNYLPINIKPSFKGVTTPESKGMFVFDLDGTLAKGSQDEIQKILTTAEDRNSVIVYATGRSKGEVETLRDELKAKNINLPLPEYLVSVTDNVGGAIYKNTNNNLKQIMTDKSPKSKAEGILTLNTSLGIEHKEIIAAGDYLNDMSLGYLTHIGSSFICLGNAHIALKGLALELVKQNLNAYTAQKEGAAGILEGFGKLLDKDV